MLALSDKLRQDHNVALDSIVLWDFLSHTFDMAGIQAFQEVMQSPVASVNVGGVRAAEVEDDDGIDTDSVTIESGQEDPMLTLMRSRRKKTPTAAAPKSTTPSKLLAHSSSPSSSSTPTKRRRGSPRHS